VLAQPFRSPVAALQVMLVNVGGLTSVNVTAPLVPALVVAVTVLSPADAFVDIVNFAVISVPAASPITLLTVTPVPLTLSAEPVSAVPVRVTLTLLFPFAGSDVDAGLIAVKVGGGGARTVKVMVLLVPPEVATVTLRPPGAAVAAIAKFAVSCVLLTRVMPLTVTPPPATVTRLPFVKWVPV